MYKMIVKKAPSSFNVLFAAQPTLGYDYMGLFLIYSASRLNRMQCSADDRKS